MELLLSQHVAESRVQVSRKFNPWSTSSNPIPRGVPHSVVIAALSLMLLLAGCGAGSIDSPPSAAPPAGGADTTAPVVTIAGPVSSPTYTNSSATLTTLAGNATDAVGVTQVSWSNSLGGSGTASLSGSVTSSSWSVGSITLASGTNVITVTARDAANNTSTDTISASYSAGGADTTAPVVTITGPVSSPTYTSSSATLTLAGSATDAVGVTQVSWSNSLGGSGTATGTGSWSVGSITLASGTNVITVTARDAANNTSTDTISVSYSVGGVDTTAPVVTITGPVSSPTYTSSSATLTLAGSATDAVGVTQVSWSNSLGGSGTASLSGSVTSSSWSVGSIALASGTNVITVTARDAANNTSTDTISVSYSAGGGGVQAFPGAEGFGAAATGGRGGPVLKVTNLNTSGAGSLKAALDTTGPRIVVFAVSGVIDSDIYIPHGNLTIAGQTAPGGGITIRGRLYSNYSTGIDNIIIRHVRVRPRAYTAAEGPQDQYDGMRFSLNRLVIFDHLSISFGVDETFDLFEADDVTVQYSTIEQASTAGAAGHNYGLLNGPNGWNISVHHNLFAHNSNRNPAIANGPADVRNNVAYNVRHGFIHHNPARGAFNIIGNYYKQGPSAGLYPFFFDDENGGAALDLRYYLRNNYIDDPGDLVGNVDNPWATPLAHPTFGNLSLPESPYRVTTEHNFSGYAGYVAVTTETATDAYNTVLNKAGGWPRDVVTIKSVQDTRDRTGSWGAVIPTITGLMAGLTPGTAPVDADNDGMADAWESAHGLSPTNGNDHSTVMPSGYTAIEQYINELADLLVP